MGATAQLHSNVGQKQSRPASNYPSSNTSLINPNQNIFPNNPKEQPTNIQPNYYYNTQSDTNPVRKTSDNLNVSGIQDNQNVSKYSSRIGSANMQQDYLSSVVNGGTFQRKPRVSSGGVVQPGGFTPKGSFGHKNSFEAGGDNTYG